MQWRSIPYSSQSAAMNMAIDESLVEHVRSGNSLPTLRLYGWNPSAVTIGTFQCRGDEVDTSACGKNGVDVVRRITGGGAVYHDTLGEVTYSIIAPEHLFEKDIARSYQQICTSVIDALRSLGIDAVFRPINDIIVGTKKISGNAQTRRSGVLLQHGTVLYSVDVDTMFTLLKVDKVKVSDKFVQSVKSLVTSVVLEKRDITKQQLVDALLRSFSSGKDMKVGTLSHSELRRAQELVMQKYMSEEWNNCRV